MCIYGNLVRIVHIQNRMSIDCFYPWFKNLANLRFGLKQNAFLRRWISPHRHCKDNHFSQSMLLWNIISSDIRKWKLFHKARKESNTTLSRTINTSVSTLIVLLCIFILGGDSIRSFSFAMILGVVFGTLSSIFVAAPLAYITLSKKEQKASK